MTDTTRADEVEAIMELAESYCEKRHTLGAPEYNIVTARARDTLRAATIAALTAPASKPAEGGVVDERVAFEAWAERTGRHLHKVTPCDGSKPRYLDACATMAWEAWQARAALARERGE